MKITVKSLKNKKVKEIDLPETVFAYPYKEHLVHQAVQAYRSAQRSGTAKTKDRSEVRGSGRKPWRQKGTGRARIGSLRSPLWRSGGVVHGPKPRSFEKRLSPREKRNALRSALSRRFKEDGIIVLDSFELENHRTAELAKAMGSLGVDGKALLVDHHENGNLSLAASNHPALKAVDALGVSVYDVIDRPQLVVSEEALGRLVEVLSQ